MGTRVGNKKKAKAKKRAARMALFISLTILYLVATAFFIAFFNARPI